LAPRRGTPERTGCTLDLDDTAYGAARPVTQRPAQRVVLIAMAARAPLDARMRHEAAQLLGYAQAGRARLVDLRTLKLGPAQERKPAKQVRAGLAPEPR